MGGKSWRKIEQQKKATNHVDSFRYLNMLIDEKLKLHFPCAMNCVSRI
jgi:hypothetical protein